MRKERKRKSEGESLRGRRQFERVVEFSSDFLFPNEIFNSDLELIETRTQLP
jgi:hypothetical protein